MALEPTELAEDGERQLHITRVFEAPVRVVFHCWMDPDHASQWWGPRGFTATLVSSDARPGGHWRTSMRSDDYGDLSSRGVFREIDPERRLVYTWAWESEEGTPGHETVVTVDFAEEDGRTILSFHQGPFESVEERDSHREGWSESFDRLAEHIESEHG